jgi:phage baseplate assembly protein W
MGYSTESYFQDFNPIHEGDKLKGYELEYNEDAIKNSLLNLFTIQKGEVPGKPYLGNPLNLQLFDLFDFFTQSDMETAIINVIGMYEPRVTLHRVTVNRAEEYNRIIILIEYSFVIGDSINYDSLAIPYSHNNVSYLGGRIKPTTPKTAPRECLLTK